MLLDGLDEERGSRSLRDQLIVEARADALAAAVRVSSAADPVPAILRKATQFEQWLLRDMEG